MYDSLTNAYYLQYFSRKQPDLNWENKKVRQYGYYEILARQRYRRFPAMDAFQYVAKDTTFPAFPKGYDKHIVKYYGMVTGIHGYLQEMNREVLSKYNIMTVSEGVGSTWEDACHGGCRSSGVEYGLSFRGSDVRQSGMTCWSSNVCSVNGTVHLPPKDGHRYSQPITISPVC